MSPQYKEWIYHGEPPVRTQVEETNLPRSAVDVGPSTEDVGGNMQALLRDLFGVHDVRRTAMSLKSGQNVVKNMFRMIHPTEVTLRSTMNCLKIRTSHSTGRPNTAN
jgi:hypothetical protein